MLPLVTPEAPQDEARWGEALSILDRAPTESAEQRLKRWRRLQMLFVASVIVVTIAVAVVLAVLFRGMFEARRPEATPVWQVVIGLVIGTAGLVLQVIGAVMLGGRTADSARGAAPWPR
jgi:protein-S-isoprenylcysteine O-methyltransferase Ste14